MKVSVNWLKDYVDIQREVKDLAHLLTMAGLEVEGVHSTGEGLDKVVVAELSPFNTQGDRLTGEAERTGNTFGCVWCDIREGQRFPSLLSQL
jgi:hypothetical protein